MPVSARLAGLARSRAGRAFGLRLDRNLAARRAARRLGIWAPRGPRMPPDGPVGVKLELTHRCNLSCPFCYTDSPRHTRAKTADLSDDDWRAVVADAIDCGVVEAVVTGGEPFLRRSLTLETVESLSRAGIGTTLNTNGWFVDDEVADRLGAVEGLLVNVSLDGATPELHDGARGGRGSWARAIAAADRLLARGARVRLIHVATPANVEFLEHLLEHAWLLGAGSVRLTRVGALGAAARGGDWGIDSRSLFAAADGFRERRGDAMRVDVNTASSATLAALEDVAPAALLVRPSGAVLIDSVKPFRFGTVPAESLRDCWGKVMSTWPHPDVVAWARAIDTSDGIARSDHVPYRDEEVALVPVPTRPAATRAVAADRIPSGVPDLPAEPDLAGARRAVVELALSRRYRHGRIRFTGSGSRGRYVRVLDGGRTCRLNETAAVVMDTCADGAPLRALDRLAAAHPAVQRRTIEDDVLASVRSLLDRKVLVATGA